jgi:molecular chaperone DnaK
MTLTRAKFEELTHDLTERTVGPFKRALQDAGVTDKEIDEIILVGGSTRMPMIQELVKRLGGGKEPHKGVNPDEVVAVGAAIQAGVLGGEVKDVVLLDVTPLTLGIETLGGVMDKLVERNTTIPTRRSRTYTTAADGQTTVEVHVLQGEREMARDNKTLGRFHLTGIPPAPRGIPQIEVTFDIDANGIVNVAAKDLATNQQQSITISGTTSLAKDEIDRMIRDAQSHAQDDAARREEAETKNAGETLAYQTEKQLRDLGDKVPADVRTATEEALSRLKAALESNDVERIRATSDEVRQATYRLSELLYQQSSQQYAGATTGGETQEGGAQGGDSDVIDAEYKAQ